MANRRMPLSVHWDGQLVTDENGPKYIGGRKKLIAIRSDCTYTSFETRMYRLTNCTREEFRLKFTICCPSVGIEYLAHEVVDDESFEGMIGLCEHHGFLMVYIEKELLDDYEDPLQAASVYMQWYWTITRRWIYRPVQRSPLTFHPRGHIERTMADTLRQIDTTIGQLLHDRPSPTRIFGTLQDMREHIHMVLQNVPSVPTLRVSEGRGDYAHASSSSHQVPRSPSSPIQAPTTFPSTSESLPPPVSRTSFVSTYSRRRPSSSSPQEIQHIAEHDEGGIIEELDQLAAVEHLDDMPIIELVVPRGRGRPRGCGRRRGRGGRGRGQAQN